MSRKASRKISNEDEIDARRARGEISCAECRRLKLKCDKKLPCSSCVRRGCPSICPNGSLSTGQGTRFVLADTAQLHAKISEMGHRIRQLEDALAIFQASVSNETHPLLRDDLLKIKFYPDKLQASEAKTRNYSSDSIDALGTLTIGDSGEAKYFGRSAGSETLFLAGAELDMSATEEAEAEVPPASPDIARLSNMFPLGTDGTWNVEKALDLLFLHLPNRARASSLCETYLEQATWNCRPIQREELIDDILAPIYKCLRERQANSATPYTISAHRLAVLFMVFALGAFVDLTLPPYDHEADNYYHLSRASLSLRSIFDSPETSTVQAVVMMAHFHSLGNRRFTMDGSWSLVSLASKLAQSIGLHRDSARWNLDAKTIQRRRVLFWEIFSTDLFHSLALGRPPSIRISYIDCEFPEDDTEKIGNDGEVLIGYYHWKYQFTKEIFSAVTELTLTAEPPSYQTILDLDRKVRERRVPPHLNVYISPEDPTCTPLVYMRGCLLTQFRAITLLYIHRSFFAQAMLDHPINPLRSPYAPSFLAAYRCASGLIKLSMQHYNRFPDLCMRWWPLWTHLFSAAIIVGVIVTRAPSSSMASTAFVELGLACDLFVKGGQSSSRVRSGLAILRKLREQACRIYSQFQAGNTLPLIDYTSNVRTDYGEDELAIFGGQTRVLVSKLLSRRNHGRRRDPPSSSNIPSPQTPSTPEMSEHGSQSPADTVPDVHPSLVEYLSLLPSSQNPPTLSGPAEFVTSPQLPSVEYNRQSTSHLYQGDPYQQSVYLLSQQGGQTVVNPYPPTTLSPGPQVDILPTAMPATSTHAQGQHTASNFAFPVGYVQDNTYSYGLPATSTSTMDGIDSNDNPSDSVLVDLGMMMSGESGMDEQWMSFMRDSGFLDRSLT